ncbi:hypothetical protein CBOM_02854 [Ceraceosorus bombacis]|uniref:Uncharacterized protein n=1 Tax=Ceraceosorus bombacis TaxID=401625 RepID=A0A0P1BGB5_9BASI|nr:hypothetical protein CBOM_02854 [Ceraceosorus bombacis]
MPSRPPPVSAVALTRVQILTPLSILISAGTLIVTSILIHPSLSEISEKHANYFTPSSAWLLVYWGVLYLLQIGFALLCVVGQQAETKKLIANGVGVRLAICNFLLAVWSITWVVASPACFVAGEVLLAIIALILLITAAILEFIYPPSAKHPLDWIFVHVPIKMLLISMLQVDVAQQLFMALEWDVSHGNKALQHSVWPTFATILSVGAFSALWIFAFQDLTWAACGIVLNLALLAYKIPDHDRPAEIVAATIASIVLQGVALFGSYLQIYIRRQQEGRIRLEEEEDRRIQIAEAEAEAAAARARADALSSHGSRSRLDSQHADQQGLETDLESNEQGLMNGHVEDHASNGTKQDDGVSVTRTLGSAALEER